MAVPSSSAVADPSSLVVAWAAASSQAVEDWQQTQIHQEGPLLHQQPAVSAFAIFGGAGSVVVFLAPEPGQGGDPLTRLVSGLGSVLEKAFCLDLERHDQETGCPSGAEVRLAEGSCEVGTVLVRGHPTDLLAAVVVASAPYSAVLSLSAVVAVSFLVAAEAVI